MTNLTHNEAISVDPWPKLIWRFSFDFEYPKLEKKIQNYVNTVGKLNPLESGQSLSTVGDQAHRPHTWDEFESFRNWIGDRVDFVWNSFNFLPKNRTVLQSWINVHDQTGVTREHYHNGSDLVVTSYLNLPKDSGYIEFRDPLEYHKAGTPYVQELQLWKPVEAVTNDVLIFPGWLVHRTQPNLTNQKRVVMTWNIGRYEL